jgi:hypothetical protein
MQISVVRVALDAEDEILDALTSQRQKGEFYERSIQQTDAGLARFSRERQQTSSFSADWYDYSQPFRFIVVTQVKSPINFRNQLLARTVLNLTEQNVVVSRIHSFLKLHSRSNICSTLCSWQS